MNPQVKVKADDTRARRALDLARNARSE